MAHNQVTPSATAALRELGRGIQLARRRRRVRQTDLAARMGVSVPTLRALESGTSGVSIGSLAMALLALGMLPRLGDLVDVGQDDIGLLMEIDALPKRIRPRKGAIGEHSIGALSTTASADGALP